MLNMFRVHMILLAVIGVLLLLPVGQAQAAVHTVSKGESLFLISKWYGTSVQDLRSANNITGDLIYPGQRLTIPSNNTYTVRSGDTLFTIAQRYGTTYQAIMAANGLSNSAINPGQVLRIPAPGPAATAVSRGGSVGNVSAADMDLLARIITAEAANQTYQTQVAVGAVVLNRVKSSLFPNTIRGVVYQVDSGGRYQFEPVLNGWINKPATDSAQRAAREALQGADPTNGALFFWESWVKNSYLNSRPVATVMGAFTFTY